MQKKGQLELLGAIIVILVVAYAGYFLIQERTLTITGNVISELPKYVGNTENNKVCLTTKANTQNIPEETRIFFNSLEQANQIGFLYSNNCK